MHGKRAGAGAVLVDGAVMLAAEASDALAAALLEMEAALGFTTGLKQRHISQTLYRSL